MCFLAVSTKHNSVTCRPRLLLFWRDGIVSEGRCQTLTWSGQSKSNFWPRPIVKLANRCKFDWGVLHFGSFLALCLISRADSTVKQCPRCVCYNRGMMSSRAAWDVLKCLGGSKKKPGLASFPAVSWLSSSSLKSVIFHLANHNKMSYEPFHLARMLGEDQLSRRVIVYTTVAKYKYFHLGGRASPTLPSIQTPSLYARTIQILHTCTGYVGGMD